MVEVAAALVVALAGQRRRTTKSRVVSGEGAQMAGAAALAFAAVRSGHLLRMTRMMAVAMEAAALEPAEVQEEGEGPARVA